MNLSMIILILAFLIDVETAIASDKISLVNMVPDYLIGPIKAWDKFLLFCGVSLIGLLSAPAAFSKKVASGVAALLVAFVLLYGQQARAADVLPTLPVKAIPFTGTVCSPTSCSGLYAGFGLSGNGSSADILASGLSQTVFSQGALLDVHGGYQVWNGTYLFAVEAGIGNNFQAGPIQFNGGSLVGYEGIKVGGSLSTLFGGNSSATTVSGQAPSSLPVFSSLANQLIAPYAWIGLIQRNGYNQGTYGAGIEYVLAQSWNLDVRYEYAPAVDSLSQMQMVRLGLNYHFGATK